MREIIKKIIPPILLDMYRDLRTDKEVKQEREVLLSLQEIPRFKENLISIGGMELKYVDSASFRFIYEELFHKEIYKFRSDSSAPLIIDAGANIGLGIIYLKKIFPGAEIIAFEPDIKVFRVLEYNINSLQLKNVRLINKGLWNEETTLRFYSEGADGGRLATDSDTEKITEITTEKLSPFLKDREVDFLKMDIEGSEYIVLKESKEYLKHVKNIFVEYHSFVGKEQYLPELLALLKEAGFRLNINVPGLISPTPFVAISNYAGMDMQLNIYGYRPG